MDILHINTRSRIDMVDITTQVQTLIANKGWSDGILTLYVPHTTAGLTINENANFKRTDFLKHLEANNIGSRLMFGGNLKLQPAFEKLNLRSADNLPTADKVVEDSFWIGLYPGITKQMMDFVAQITEEFVTNG